MPEKAVLCHIGGNGSAKAYSSDSAVYNADTLHPHFRLTQSYVERDYDFIRENVVKLYLKAV